MTEEKRTEMRESFVPPKPSVPMGRINNGFVAFGPGVQIKAEDLKKGFPPMSPPVPQIPPPPPPPPPPPKK